jgi:hypothetical protein
MFSVLVGPFLVGLAGSLHCLGMCGPLVLAYSMGVAGGTASREKMPAYLVEILSHHLMFNTGRLITYGTMGALFGFLAGLIPEKGGFSEIRGGAAMAGGLLMVTAGLVILRALPIHIGPSGPEGGAASWPWRLIQNGIVSPSAGSKLLMGLVAGMLPCMLSWAMVIKAASTRSPVAGFATMAAFGLGTVPALLLAGGSASLLSVKLRLAGERVAAVSIILMGMILAIKGLRAIV